jgi:hypothetical protein
MKKLIARMAIAAAAALTTLGAAEGAHAQGYQEIAFQRHHAAPRAAAPQAYDTQANPRYGFGPRVTIQPNDVSGGRIIGRDPDPFIRGELLRHYDSGWPD